MVRKFGGCTKEFGGFLVLYIQDGCYGRGLSSYIHLLLSDIDLHIHAQQLADLSQSLTGR